MKAEDALAKQQEQIDSLRKAVAVLDQRLRDAMRRERSLDALVRRHTSEISRLTTELNRVQSRIGQ